MTFKRIDDKTVHCIITPEDMRVYGIGIDDLFEKKNEAMEFLHMIINEARRQVNYQPKGAITSMQMAVLPDHSVSLLLSEQSGVEFSKLIQSLKGQIAGLQDAEKDARKTKIIEDVLKKEYLYEFSSFRDVVECCRFIQNEDATGIEASLYNHGKGFYLILQYEGEDEDRFNKMALSLNEFGKLVTAGNGAIAHVKETGRCILCENTIELLAKL